MIAGAVLVWQIVVKKTNTDCDQRTHTTTKGKDLNTQDSLDSDNAEDHEHDVEKGVEVDEKPAEEPKRKRMSRNKMRKHEAHKKKCNEVQEQDDEHDVEKGAKVEEKPAETPEEKMGTNTKRKQKAHKKKRNKVQEQASQEP